MPHLLLEMTLMIFGVMNISSLIKHIAMIREITSIRTAAMISMIANQGMKSRLDRKNAIHE